MPHLKRTAAGVLGGFAGVVGLSVVAGVLITATVTPAIALSGYAATSAVAASAIFFMRSLSLIVGAVTWTEGSR